MSSVLKYGGGNAEVTLVGHAGQPFDLTRANPSTNRQQVTYEWAPEDRRVMDLECRIQVLSPIGSADTTSYQVLYTVEVGAGESVFGEPRPKIYNRSELTNELVLPDRGTVFRANARRMKLGFRLVQLVAPIEKVNLQLSVQPCGAGSEVPQLPRMLLAAATNLVAFPLTAARFRVRQSDGRPWALAGCTFTLYNLCGRSFGNVDASFYSDWTPIPVPASFALFSASAILEFQ